MKKTLTLLCLLLAPIAFAAEGNLTVNGVVVTETPGSTIVAVDWSASTKGETIDDFEAVIKVTLYDTNDTVMGSTTMDMSWGTSGCGSCVRTNCGAFPCIIWYRFGPGLYADEEAPCEDAAGPCQDGVKSVCYCNSNPTGGPSLEVGVTGGEKVKVELIFPGDIDQSDNVLTANY